MVLGSIQFLAAVGLRTSAFCWLSARITLSSLLHGVGEHVCLLPYGQQEREISKTGTTFLYSVMIYILSIG